LASARQDFPGCAGGSSSHVFRFTSRIGAIGCRHPTTKTKSAAGNPLRARAPRRGRWVLRSEIEAAAPCPPPGKNPGAQVAGGGQRSDQGAPRTAQIVRSTFNNGPLAALRQIAGSCHEQTRAVQQKRRLYPIILSALAGTASLGRSTILGSRIVKVEPRLGSLSTVMSPPII
jgi:hypothetical protein